MYLVFMLYYYSKSRFLVLLSVLGPLFSSMIMPDRVQLILWRPCLKLKNTAYGMVSVLSRPESERAFLGHTETTHCCDTEVSFYCSGFGDCT